MILELTEAALSDLRAVREYTLERWGEEKAEAYIGILWAKFQEILSNPMRWRFRPDLFPNCQVARQGKHIILFRVRRRVLQVVRVLHTSMDISRHVPGWLR